MSIHILVPLPASKPEDPRFARGTARVELWRGDIHIITEGEDGNEDDLLALDPYWARVLAVKILAELQQLEDLRGAA